MDNSLPNKIIPEYPIEVKLPRKNKKRIIKNYSVEYENLTESKIESFAVIECDYQLTFDTFLEAFDYYCKITGVENNE